MNKYLGKYKIWLDHKGYPCIWIDSKEIKLHVYIWELANGSKPKGHEIHHIDNNKANYSLANLELLDFSAHRRLHCGWIKKNGIWIAKFCSRCKKTLTLENFYYVKTRNIHSALCKICHNNVVKKRNKLPQNIEKLRTYKREYYRKNYGKQR